MFEFTVVRVVDSRNKSFLRPWNKHRRGAFKKRFYSLEEAALFFINSYKSLGCIDDNLTSEQRRVFAMKFRAMYYKKEKRK